MTLRDIRRQLFDCDQNNKPRPKVLHMTYEDFYEILATMSLGDPIDAGEYTIAGIPVVLRDK